MHLYQYQHGYLVQDFRRILVGCVGCATYLDWVGVNFFSHSGCLGVRVAKATQRRLKTESHLRYEVVPVLRRGAILREWHQQVRSRALPTLVHCGCPVIALEVLGLCTRWFRSVYHFVFTRAQNHARKKTCRVVPEWNDMLPLVAWPGQYRIERNQ